MSIASRLGLVPKKGSIASRLGLVPKQSSSSQQSNVSSNFSSGNIASKVGLSNQSNISYYSSRSRSSISRNRSSAQSTPAEPVLEVVESVPEPDVTKVDVTSEKDVNVYNTQVDAYNQQFKRQDGFKPGEPVYVELDKYGSPKDELLVKGTSDKLERSGFSVDSKGFFESADKTAKSRDSWRSESVPVTKVDPNKKYYGRREPGKETVSEFPTYNVIGSDKNDDLKLNVTQKAEYIIGKTFLPRYKGMSKDEYFETYYEGGVTPFGRLNIVGKDVSSGFQNVYSSFDKNLKGNERYGAQQLKDMVSVTPGLTMFVKNRDVSDSDVKLYGDVGRSSVKFMSNVGDVFIGQTLQNPVRDVGLFMVGGVVGKAVKVSKIVFKPLTASIGSSPVFVRSAVKGVGLGLKTSVGGVIGASVVYDISKAEDSSKRATEIAKQFILFGAGYKAGLGKPRVTTKTVKQSTKDFPDGYKQVSLNFYPKSEMAVKSGKSQMSKASIRRQNIGLPQKGKKIEKFFEYRGEQSQIIIPRKGVDKGQTNYLKIEKLKPSQQTTTKISTGGLPYQDKGGLNLKRFGVTEQARATKQTDTFFRIKPIQRGVKYESTPNYIKTRPRSQSRLSPANFKEIVNVQTSSGQNVLLQEQKQKQLFSVSIKQLAKSKPNKIYTQRQSFGEQYQKQNFNLDKGQAPQSQNILVPSSSEAQTITQSQGRGKVIDKILAKARAKADARALELEQQKVIIKKPESTFQSQSLISETKSQSGLNVKLDDSTFSNLFKKKKPSLVLTENVYYGVTTKNVQSVSAKQKLNQGVGFVPVLALGQAQRLSQENVLKPSLALSQSQGLKLSSGLVVEQTLQPALRLNQAQSLSLSQDLSQAQASETQQTQIIQVIPSSTSRPRLKQDESLKIINPKPITPEPLKIINPKPIKPTPTKINENIIPPFFPRLRIPKSQVKERASPNFTLFVRREGVFSSKGVFGSSREAFLKGSEIVGGTASASFKIKDASGQTVSPSWFGLGARFRPSKKEKGVIVERRRYRISSPGELEEITFKGLASQRKKRKGGFNIF